MISEDKFYDKAKDFALLTNTKKEFYTLTEYKDKVSPLQTDKNGKVVYLYTNDPAKQDVFIQSANKKGYDVLMMNSPLDGHFISHIERKLDNVNVKRVDASVADKLIDNWSGKISIVWPVTKPADEAPLQELRNLLQSYTRFTGLTRPKFRL